MTLPESSRPARSFRRVRSSGDAGGRTLAARWGCSPLNRLLDRAGRHRRLAGGLALLAPPVLAMGVASIVELSVFYGVAHLALGICFLWLAADLIGRRSLLDARDHPRTSTLLVPMAAGMVCLLRPDGSGTGVGFDGWSTIGLGGIGLAVALLTAAERSPEPLLVLLGRVVLVAGAFLLGAHAGLSLVWAAGDLHPADALGRGVIGAVLLAMSTLEGRLLVRGAALFRIRARS